MTESTITINELKNNLESFNKFKFTNFYYQIHEYFANSREYRLDDLNCVLDVMNNNKVALFYDEKNEIYKGYGDIKALMGFPINSIKRISYKWDTGKNWTCYIRFNDGLIKIERIEY